jgi:MoxR-like ATPase
MQEKVKSLVSSLQQCGYIADRDLATALTLMDSLSRPLLIEGEAGVGKTAIAAALACSRDTELIRIQCYEGIDADSVLYEWNYTQQLLHIRLHEKSESALLESDLYSDRFLLERPLLKAIRQPVSPILLIDEVDRADEAFEAFLLEVLSEFTVTIPEIGTIEAISIPRVILTSNGSRELSDALRRRCLFHYANYPAFEKELAILKAHHPDIDQALLHQVTRFVQEVRQWDITKRPGVAETLDWARALCSFNVNALKDQPETVRATLSCLLKTTEDLKYVNDKDMTEVLADVLVGSA